MKEKLRVDCLIVICLTMLAASSCQRPAVIADDGTRDTGWEALSRAEDALLVRDLYREWDRAFDNLFSLASNTSRTAGRNMMLFAEGRAMDYANESRKDFLQTLEFIELAITIGDRRIARWEKMTFSYRHHLPAVRRDHEHFGARATELLDTAWNEAIEPFFLSVGDYESHRYTQYVTRRTHASVKSLQLARAVLELKRDKLAPAIIEWVDILSRAFAENPTR